MAPGALIGVSGYAATVTARGGGPGADRETLQLCPQRLLGRGHSRNDPRSRSFEAGPHPSQRSADLTCRCGHCLRLLDGDLRHHTDGFTHLAQASPGRCYGAARGGHPQGCTPKEGEIRHASGPRPP